MTDDTDDDDLLRFPFDKRVHDSSNGIKLDVTVVDFDSDILLKLASGSLDITFFLKPFHARMLAQYLLRACDVYETGQTGTPETD